MNTYKLLLILIAFLIASMHVDARHRASKHEDYGFRTGMDRLDMLSRAKRFINMELVQSSDTQRKRRNVDEAVQFEDETSDKHRSSGIV